MASIEVRDVTGAVVGQRELPANLFEASVNVPVMHQVVVAAMAARRAGTHSTKTRGEVSGGGKKPWRQKGTGRARHGSTRSPLWSGGGVAHGPQPGDHVKRVNKKMRKAALRSALTDAAVSGKLAVVDGLAFEGPRTKDAAALLQALELEGRVLLVIARPDQPVELSFRNLPYVKVDYPGNLSTYDVLYADRVLFTTQALDELARPSDIPAPSGVAPSTPRAREEPDATEPEPSEPEDEQVDQPSEEPDVDSGEGSPDEAAEEVEP
jgi:large subunit ribosomal protein L4